jgi:hypothetical protein
MVVITCGHVAFALYCKSRVFRSEEQACERDMHLDGDRSRRELGGGQVGFAAGRSDMHCAKWDVPFGSQATANRAVLSDILLRVLKDAAYRSLGRFLVPAGPFVAVATLAGVIDKNFWVAAARLYSLVDVGHRDALVLIAEMEHGADLGFLIADGGDLTPVIANRGHDASELCRSTKGNRAAKTVADNRDVTELPSIIDHCLAVLENLER